MNIRDLINRVGSPTRVAQICGIRVPSIYSWRAVPQDRCAQIEHATTGAVTVEEMRPDIRWYRVADPSWPHSQGRPLVDVCPDAHAADLLPAAVQACHPFATRPTGTGGATHGAQGRGDGGT